MNNGRLGQPVAGTGQNTLKRPRSWLAVHRPPCLYFALRPDFALTAPAGLP